MLRIPVTKACAFNFRLEFCFNLGPRLPCVITGYWPSIHVSDFAKFGTTGVCCRLDTTQNTRIKASSGERSVGELSLGAKSSYLIRPLHRSREQAPISLVNPGRFRFNSPKAFPEFLARASRSTYHANALGYTGR